VVIIKLFITKATVYITQHIDVSASFGCIISMNEIINTVLANCDDRGEVGGSDCSSHNSPNSPTSQRCEECHKTDW
jgi:hypothetical protein